MDLAIKPEDKDLAAFDPFYLAFDFVEGFHVREGRDVFEFVFLDVGGHFVD